MSTGEIWWRVVSLGKDAIDTVRIVASLYPRKSTLGVIDSQKSHKRGFAVPKLQSAYCEVLEQSDDSNEWRQSLIRNADNIAAHRLSYLGLHEQFVGDPVDWYADHASGKRSDCKLAMLVDYRDLPTT